MLPGGPMNAAIQTVWTRRYDGGLAFGTNQAVALALAPDGGIIVSGHGRSTQGDWDYLVAKYSPTGEMLWARRYASPESVNDQVRSMAVNGEGSVYLTGTSMTVKYSSSGEELWTAPYGGRGIVTGTNGSAYVTGFSELDFATVKLDSRGSNVWTRLFDQSGGKDNSSAITVDSDGNVLTAGVSTFYVPTSDANVVTIKYSPDGAQIWRDMSYQGGLLAFGEIKTIFSRNQEYVVHSGNTFSSPTFLTTKLDHAGNFLWGYGFPGSIGPTSAMQGMSVDSADNVYLCGQVYPLFNDTLTAFATIKLNSMGTSLWVQRYGDGIAGIHSANGITLDANDNPHVTGYSAGSGTGNDFATIKYDPDGNQQWVERYNGPFNGDDQATAIAVDQASGAVYVAGFSQTTSNLTEMVLIKYAELQPIQILENGAVRLQFFDVPGHETTIQATTNFPNWQDIGTAVADPDGICRFDDTNAPSYSSRFYRRLPP